MNSFNELLALIRERCEPEEIIDLADISVDEILLYFRGHVMEHRDRFEEFLDLYEGGMHD